MKTYSVIYADPPWSYNDKRPRGGAAHHYTTAELVDLGFLKVDGRLVLDLAAEDCALFMWATWPLIDHALQLGTFWGFKFKTCAFTWVKTTKSGGPAFGLGRYTRGNTEPCLLFTRGKPRRVDAGVPQVFLDEGFSEESLFAQRGRHSAKPPEVRDRIVRLMGDVPRIELFARERVAGWDAFGNELAQISDSTEAA